VCICHLTWACASVCDSVIHTWYDASHH
jgi:hypothetical protein